MTGNVSELLAPESSIFKRIMIGVITPINIGGCDIPLAREEVNQTPFAVIAGVTTRFKRRRVFTPAIIVINPARGLTRPRGESRVLGVNPEKLKIN